MIFFWISQITSTFFAFLYPAYNTFKTLVGRPGHEHQYGRWMMYWCIIAIVVAWEYSLEWLVRWIWGYAELKTLFLLFLVLPQTQGSTYIFTQFLLPTLLRHEAEIDHQIASLKSHFLGFLSRQLQNIVDLVLGKRPVANGAPGADGVAQNLWQSYGASVMATGAALLQSAQQSTAEASKDQPSVAAAPPVAPRPVSGMTQRNSSSSQSKGLPAKPSYLRADSTRSKGSNAGNGAGNTATPPFFPIPQTAPSSRSASTISSNADLPVHPKPYYTQGYSTVRGE